MESIAVTSLAFSILFGASTVLISGCALVVSIMAYRDKRKEPS